MASEKLVKVTFKDGNKDNTNDASPTAVVTSFSNGRLKLDDNNSVRFGCFASTGANFASRHERMLIAETDRTRYVGRNFGPDAINAPNLCRYMLGVYNKQTNKIHIVDASLYHLRPSLDDSDTEQETADKEKKDGEDLTLVQKHARLTEEFGTKKGKRMVEARLRSRAQTQSLETVMESAVKQSAPVSSSSNETDRTTSASASIPPHNKDASQPDDVYLLNDLISPAEILAMSGVASAFVNATARDIDGWRENGTYPGYVMHQLSILPIQTDVRQHRSAILLYWTYLHQLLHECNKTSEANLLKEAPNIVRRTLFNRFTKLYTGKQGKSTRRMPASLTDLLRSYMLVLCLILEEFSLDFTALQRDLDISLPHLEKCFKALGCKTSQQTSKTITGQTTKACKATLVVPLTFPTYKAKGGRK